MIKRKVKVKKKVDKVQKRINPYFHHSQVTKILNEIDPKNKIDFKLIGEGAFGETYYFKLNQNKLFENVILKPDDYILKIYKRNPPINERKYLIKLSKYGLIPKIYVINKNFTIMKYIDGETFLEFEDKNRDSREIIRNILLKITNLIEKWHNLGFAHGDLGKTNILVTKNHKVYIIDPYFENSNEFNFDLDIIKGYWNYFYQVGGDKKSFLDNIL